MDADTETSTHNEARIRETYRRMSTPGADPGELFAHDDMAVAGSGQGELMYGPEVVGHDDELVAAEPRGRVAAPDGDLCLVEAGVKLEQVVD